MSFSQHRQYSLECMLTVVLLNTLLLVLMHRVRWRAEIPLPRTQAAGSCRGCRGGQCPSKNNITTPDR
ncbi:Ferrous iron transport protein B [compost metagenome]